MDEDDLKRLRKISREQQLEHEAQFGRLRSKSWDTKPSTKQNRRKTKLNLKKMVDHREYDKE